MMGWLLKLNWNLGGWKLAGKIPDDLQKMILVVAPHTSWRDFFVGLQARRELNIKHAHFLAKKELFDGPMGKWFIKLGGIPVDRFGKKGKRLGVVKTAIRLFNERDNFILAISPEATRQRVDKLKTGFYYIAKNANVPIVLVGFDYKNKEVVLSNPIYVSEDEKGDIQKIIHFFSTIQGANPQQDLTHLEEKKN